MRDFKNYQKGKMPNDSQNKAMEMLSAFARKYEGASEDEILNAIVAEAENGKKKGTLTNAEIDNFANMILPLLNASQKQKLAKIIEKIKKL